jgi:hypothetical protein
MPKPIPTEQGFRISEGIVITNGGTIESVMPKTITDNSKLKPQEKPDAIKASPIRKEPAIINGLRLLVLSEAQPKKGTDGIDAIIITLAKRLAETGSKSRKR